MSEINRFRGDTYRLGFILKKNKKTYDITDHSFAFTVDTRENPDDESTQVFKIDAVISNASLGEIYFEFTEEQADLLGTYYFDIQMVNADAEKRTLDKGTIVFSQDINKG